MRADKQVSGAASTAEILLRRLAALCVLVGLGLAVSLLPATSVGVAATPEPAHTLSPVWPGSGVQQGIGTVAIPIFKATVWAGSGPTDGRVRVVASLVTGDDSRVLRQSILEIPENSRLLPYAVEFQLYEPPAGEIRLQLAVSELSTNFATFGVAGGGSDLAAPTLNGATLDFQGPLAFRIEGYASGFWVAWMLGGAQRGLGIAALALLALGVATRVFGDRALRLATAFGWPVGGARPTRDWRRWPVYVWLLAVYPALSFTTSNLETARPEEVLAIMAAALLLVAVAVLLAFVLTRDAHRAAATVAIGTVAFFAFGHLSNLLGDRLDDRLLLGVLVAGTGGVGLFAFNRPGRVRAWGPYLNVASLLLVAMPALTIGYQLTQAASVPDPVSESVPDLRADPVMELGPNVTTKSDIYYIILDAYSRADSIPGFDNREFIETLERRGFVVPAGARSNYTRTHWSIPSSLNMRYLEEDEGGERGAGAGAAALVRDHRLGRILQGLGYEYVHVASGYELTSASAIAEVKVDFSPEGLLTTAGAEGGAGGAVFGEFTRQFLRTTLLRPFLPGYFELPGNEPYPWWHPARTVETFEFLGTVAREFEGPKFVLAHVVKPHAPFNLDQYGNVVLDPLEGFADDHDPGVPSAYVGQLVYLNSLLLDTIDAIIEGSAQPPIIVIASDHGEAPDLQKYNILMALYLPDGGAGVMYEDITLVNMFRLVLDRYLGLGLGLLEDRVVGP